MRRCITLAGATACVALLMAPLSAGDAAKPGVTALASCVLDGATNGSGLDLVDCHKHGTATWNCYFGSGDVGGSGSLGDYREEAVEGAGKRHIVYPTGWAHGTVYYDSWKYLWCVL